MEPIRLPYLEEALVDELERIIPEQCPTIDMSDRQIWKYAGKRELVKWIRHQFNIQQEYLLGGSS